MANCPWFDDSCFICKVHRNEWVVKVQRLEDMTKIASWEKQMPSLSSLSLSPNVANATCPWRSLAFQSDRVSLTTLASCGEASQFRMWDCYLDGNPSCKEPASWIGSARVPARSKPEVTIFLVKNQGCKAREQLITENKYS